MGSGKSSLGKRLAKSMNYRFVDLDDLVEQLSEKTTAYLFTREGESSFRNWEKLALHRTFEMDQVVVALGGGTPCFFDNMLLINTNGLSIYLQMSAISLTQRIQSSKKIRPLTQEYQGEKLFEFVQNHLAQREPYYLQSKITVNALSPSVSLLLNAIHG
jgi:shikimate kinase